MAFRIPFTLLQLFLLAAMTAPLLKPTSEPWWLENLLGLQLQWSLLALVSIVVASLYSRPAAVLLLFFYGILFLYNFGGLYTPFKPKTAGGIDFTIAQLNLRYNNPQASAVFSRLRQANYDMLVIQEVSDRQVDYLDLLKDHYPYSIGSYSLDSHSSGHVLLSRWPLTNRRIHALGYVDGRVITAEVNPTASEKPIRIFALHPASPRNREYWELRNSTLAFVAREISRLGQQRQIVVGDLNVSPWSSAFRQLLEDSGLKDSGTGQGYIPTWSLFPRYPVLRYLGSAYIDHCLVSRELEIHNKRAQLVPGSDHQLLVTRLRLD